MKLVFAGALLFAVDLCHAQRSIPPEKNKSEPAPQRNAPGGIKVKDLFADKTVMDQFQKVMTITDVEYDALRAKVAEALVNEKLISKGDFAFSDLALGWNDGHKYIQVDSTPESKNELQLFLYRDRIEVDSLYGGSKFTAAIGEYLKALTTETAGVDLPYLMGVFQKDIAALDVNLKCYERTHDKNSVIKGTLQTGAHKGQEFAKLLFKHVPGVANRLPEPGITIDLYGVASFDPRVKVGAPSNAPCKAPVYDSILR